MSLTQDYKTGMVGFVLTERPARVQSGIGELHVVYDEIKCTVYTVLIHVSYVSWRVFIDGRPH